MADNSINHEDADKLIAAIDIDQYEKCAQLAETIHVKVLPPEQHNSEHPFSDYMGLKNHSTDDVQAFLRWREKPEGVPVKLKVPGETTVYVAKKGNYPFLYRERVC
ncbi:hypothetical protein [Kordiimonas pumila]|uniref:Uncharacterized protein n=1 Tax=Kordiimonas pumila TaxID=2161677 RepID=A0ABV7D7P6_9PROT|nr:hypothetical protein [Kordiimonas pumila]